MVFRHAHKCFCQWIQHRRKCKHITGIIWLDLYHFVIASSTNFSMAHGKRFFLGVWRFLHLNFPLRAYYYFILSTLFVVVMCVLRKRFWCFHSLNFAFHTLFIPHIQAAVAAAFNGYKSHFESQTGFCKTDKRESKITAHTHTNHIWLGLESAIRHWKTLTIDCACECVCGNGRSLFSTTITNAFILPLKKHKNVLTYHHPCVCILQMDSLPFFFFFAIRIVSIVRNDFLCYFFLFASPLSSEMSSMILPFLF